VRDRWRVRQYRSSDFSSVVQLLATAFASSSSESVRFSLSTTNTAAFVAEVKGLVVGVAMGIGFGQTGWVSSVVVSPDWQRRGVGSALTERAVEFALVEAHTVLLLALEPARRMYERLGFVDDGSYGTWILPSASLNAAKSWAPHLNAKRAAAPAQVLEQCLELDRLATGENRRSYLQPLASTMRMALPTGSSGDDTSAPVGYMAQLSWGAGPIIAADAEVGIRLVREALAANPNARIEFPDANEGGQAIMRELGLLRVDDDFRMRLGPPIPGFRPHFIYKVLTPAVG
jgi:GNAT superfamily N-acetyltransferase